MNRTYIDRLLTVVFASLSWLCLLASLPLLYAVFYKSDDQKNPSVHGWPNAVIIPLLLVIAYLFCLLAEGYSAWGYDHEGE